MRQAVILAGGAGTRLQARLKGLPKPMVSVAGKPLLEHQIELARSYKFSEVVMLVSHGANAIVDYFGSGDRWGIGIRYIEDSTPRGTAGAILDAFDHLSDRFVVLYGDTMLNVDLDRLCRKHQEFAADATLFLHPNDHPHDSDLVDIDSDGRVTDFYPYPHDSTRYYANLVNAALYVIEKASLEKYRNLTGIVDFGKHLFPQMLHDGALLHGYRSPEYIKDAGTPERLDKVESDIRSGLVERSSLAAKAAAVFLDRDGTLNKEVDRVSSVSQLQLIEGVSAPLRRLNRSHYRTAVVTNQPVIARGDCSEVELKEIHNKLETLLGREGAYVDAIYYCPHHPDGGFEGERSELKFVCSCRKPAPGMINQAANDMNIDLQRSWLIGDTTTDIMAARAAGLTSVIVQTGHAGRDRRYPVRADFEFPDLALAVEFILDRYPKLLADTQKFAKDIAEGDRVIVAGLAHSGKSTWSSILKIAIEDLGHRCVIVSLDNWLKSAESRDSAEVLGRFDVQAIEDFVTNLYTAGESGTFSMPYYDRYHRQSYAEGETLTIGSNDVVIFEGVIGLLIPSLLRCASRRVFIEISEPLRRRNFWTEYRARGFTEDEIENLYDQRETEETMTVLASKSAADIVIAERLQ